MSGGNWPCGIGLAILARALLQYHRPGGSRRPLLHPTPGAAESRRGPNARPGQAVFRPARPAPDRQDLRAAGAARPAQQRLCGLVPLRVRQRRRRPGRARGQGRGDARHPGRAGIARSFDVARRLSGRAMARHPGEVGSERRPARGADPLGGGRSDAAGAAARRDRHSGRRHAAGGCCASCAPATIAAPDGFPQSVVLCGLRDVADYRIDSPAGRPALTGGSPFNIAATSLRLGDFTRDQTQALLVQHTEETGQSFTSAALDTVWTQTQGQPWLVNALASETLRFRAGRQRPVAPGSRCRRAPSAGAARRAPGDAPGLSDPEARRGARAACRRADSQRRGRERPLGPRPGVRAPISVWSPAMLRRGWPIRSMRKSCRAN